MGRHYKAEKFSWEKICKTDVHSTLAEWVAARDQIHNYCMLNGMTMEQEINAGEILRQARLAELLPSVGLKAALNSLGALS
jgi:hypothetical protein